MVPTSLMSNSTSASSEGLKFFTHAELQSLDPRRIPYHLAFIPDGNRRWAKTQQAPTTRGHREGADILMDITRACLELGVKVVTFFVFSTENWSRPDEEVQALMWLFDTYLLMQQPTMIESSIRLQTIGDLSRLPPSLIETIESTKAITKDCNKIDLVLAMNYGGRDEICRAVQALLDDYTHKRIKREDINEITIRNYLDTAQWKDPDLLIRTSGEMRLSNFLLWQTSYTEVFVSDVLWPDFTPQHLLDAVQNFQKRERRWGGL